MADPRSVFGSPTGILPASAPKDIEQRRLPLVTRDPAAALPRQALVPPFWQVRPPGANDLQGTVRGTLAAGVGQQLALLPSPAYNVIPSYNAVLAGLKLTVSAPTALLDITFTLLNNGAPVQGWDAFRPDNVAANAIIQEVAGPLQLSGQAVLTVLVTNNSAAGPWDVAVALSGWQWPRTYELATFGVIGQ